MSSEHVRSTAHHSSPRLPPVAMVPAFPAFSAAYSSLCGYPSAHAAIFQLVFQLMQSLTKAYALAYAQPRSSNSSSSASPHVLGRNAYIARPFGHSSQIEQTQSDILTCTLFLGPKAYLKTLTNIIFINEIRVVENNKIVIKTNLLSTDNTNHKLTVIILIVD